MELYTKFPTLSIRLIISTEPDIEVNVSGPLVCKKSGNQSNVTRTNMYMLIIASHEINNKKLQGNINRTWDLDPIWYQIPNLMNHIDSKNISSSKTTVIPL